MTDRYPGYDVLNKRNGPSWNEPTRRVVDARLNLPTAPRFFNDEERRTLSAVCERIMPQTRARARVDLAAHVDDKMSSNRTDGYRYPGMPPQGEAWRRGLAALEEVARKDHGQDFSSLTAEAQVDMLRSMEAGTFTATSLGEMLPTWFFTSRVVADIVNAYYAHPTAWSEIGWGGPASPRGYVRLQAGMRDPWEPVEVVPERATPGEEAAAERRNRHVR